MNNTITIDGWGPMPVVRPTTIADVGAHVREAWAKGTAIYPVGGGTMRDVGLPPTRQGIALDTRGLDAVIDYPARDMTITVQAGSTVAKLQELLATEKQHLPVDVPFPEQATLGGALATNASGPRRFGFGTLRDYVIGISVVNDEGTEVKAGGRVVKNVAGYDLMKLFTGSFGTLGIITQVTLKVPPRPENQTVVLVTVPAEQLAHALNDLIPTTKTRPNGVSVSNNANHATYTLAIGFAEQTTTVDWQVAQLRSELPTTWDIQIRHHDAATTIINQRRDTPHTGPLTFKANVLPVRTAAFISHAARLIPQAKLVAYAGNGIVYGSWEPASVEQAQPVLAQLLHAATDAGGNLVLPRCPTAWKTVLPVWGQTRGDFAVMQAIKAKLDPRNVFNPGRFVGGI